MPVDQKTLIKDWIAYLKRLGVVAMQSDPKTGQLNYQRPVSYDDLSTFLRLAFVRTEITEQDIENAIKTALTKNRPRPSSLPAPNQTDAGQQTQTPSATVQTTQASSQGKQTSSQKTLSPEYQRGKESAEDVEAREPRQSPAKKSRWKFSEAIRDVPGPEISEQVVEEVFNLLIARIQQIQQEKQAKDEANKQQQLQQGLNKILQYVSTLSSGEIRELYRLLK